VFIGPVTASLQCQKIVDDDEEEELAGLLLIISIGVSEMFAQVLYDGGHIPRTQFRVFFVSNQYGDIFETNKSFRHTLEAAQASDAARFDFDERWSYSKMIGKLSQTSPGGKYVNYSIWIFGNKGSEQGKSIMDGLMIDWIVRQLELSKN